MKASKEDLHNIGQDFYGLIQRHENAIKYNPDLAAETIKLRDKWLKRFDEITNEIPERPKQ